MLLDARANVNQQVNQLFELVWSNFREGFKPFRIPWQDSFGYTPLHIAALNEYRWIPLFQKHLKEIQCHKSTQIERILQI